MSTTGTDADEIPTDTTPEYQGPYLYEDEAEPEEEEEDVILNSEDFISGAFLSDKCTVPFDILEMDYSYGYNCKKLFNIVAPDENTIIFIGGNLIHFFDVATRTLTFRRSYLGGGIGHITVNPNSDYPHLAIAENGDRPPIIIYEWPSMEIVGILKGGAAKRYAHINYSPDGEMLVSQSYAPDFLITVWLWKKWRRSAIVLRTKSHVHDVYKCMFSPYVPGQITTAGSGHIKFWKMAETFTGLKLQGELGRFGKTEITDIVGIYPMPDEKVISGTEWGNLLVWEAGLIKLEVLRTHRRKCHEGPVLQLEYNRPKGEIWSVSQDGWLRAWEYRVIDDADPSEEDRVVQMLPSYEREIPDVEFSCICKKRVHDLEDTFYYAQDSNGGIWLVDLVLRADFEPAQQLLASHAGHVTDIAPCPWGPYIATIGESGKLFLYNYEERTMLHEHKFLAGGKAMIWLPLKVDSSGCNLIAGFDDGVIRLFTINFQMRYVVKIIQSTKPHNKPVSVITLNDAGNLFVSGGEDLTIFIYQLRKKQLDISLTPIGFVVLAAKPTCFTWNPERDSVLLVGCQYGQLCEYNLPLQPLPYTKISYLLHTIKPVRQRFTTCKAQIRRELHIGEIMAQKAAKVERKKREILQIKADNPGLEVDEETYLEDSEPDEVLEPLHIPEIPNPIYFTQYTPEDTIWLSMGGYDAGYIYEYQMDQKQNEPLKATMIADGDDIEMYGYIYSPDGKYIITSIQNGSIRVNRINPDDFRDLSDYWMLSMHDNYNGRITKMCFSYDGKFFFSAGEDGNIFSYIYKPEDEIEPPKIRRLSMMTPSREIAQDKNYQSLSLEEMMIKAEEDRQMRLANEHKRKVKLRLRELTGKLSALLDRNCKLHKSQRYKLSEFIVDNRIMKALDDMLEDKVALEKRKVAYDVERSTIALKKMRAHYSDVLDAYPFFVSAINGPQEVYTINLRGLGEQFYGVFKVVQGKVEEEKLKCRLPERKEIEGEGHADVREKIVELEPFLAGLSPSTIAFKLGVKINRMLNNYRQRKRQRELRQEDWNKLYESKPLEGVNHQDDIKALEHATANIGDFKLKSCDTYKVPASMRETTVTKYQELLEARLRACKYMVSAFNDKVRALRNKKVRMIQMLEGYTAKIQQIHQELPEFRIMQPPPVPVMTDADFPEREMEVRLTVEDNFEEYLKNMKPQIKIKLNPCDNVDFEKEILQIEPLPDTTECSRNIILHVSLHTDIKFNPFNKKIPVKDDFKESQWEIEIKYRRLLKKLHEQETIIDKMNSMIAEFDKEVSKLSEERFLVSMRYTCIDLHILVLNQELAIVKDFEVVENDLGAVALQKWNEMMDIHDDMKRIELKIEAHNYTIENNVEQIKGIQQTFLTAAKDNKFWDFLRRIFKKKYRPPKLTDESESSSSSSSSSSESEEDTGSLDSRDIGPIRLDESICPKGCDRELYDFTFTLRGRRHDLEKQIAEEKKIIDNYKKDLEQAAKKMKVFELASKKAQNELEKYQALKQRTLNEVNCLVTLKLSQLKHINADGYSVAKLSDTLVFGTERLAQLHKRVSELQMETLEERNKHRKNKLHLHRMTVDCHHMERTIAKLKKDITKKMVGKFGSRVKIDDIEETILKRMILNLRMSMLNLGASYEKEIDTLRTLYGEKQVEVKNIIQENTARLQILASLSHEKVRLTKFLKLQARDMAKAKGTQDLYFIEDIDKLNAIVKSQQDQIQLLKSEIKKLSTKSLPPKPITYESEEKMPEKPEFPILEGDYGSLDELYSTPAFHTPKQLSVIPISDQEVTEEEIVLCIHELMKEVVDAVMETDVEDTEENKMIKIMSEVVEQVPMNYLGQETSLEYIVGLIKDIVTDTMKTESQTIIETISKTTSRSTEEIASLVESIISKITETEATSNEAPERTKETERTGEE